MKIEVFKEYDGKLRLFDAINPDYITWMFDSENHRDGATAPPYRNQSELGPTQNLPPTDTFPDEGRSGAPSFANASAPYENDLDGTIYFDSSAGEYRVYSTQKNVVLDYVAPRLLSYTGNFTAFESDEHGHSGRHTGHEMWTLEMLIKDDSGIDGDVYEISAWKEVLQEWVTQIKRTRENGTSPYWEASESISSNGIYVEIQQSPVDKTLYKVNIEIDPEKVELNACTGGIDDPIISYFRLNFKFFDIAGNTLEGPLDKVFVKYHITEEDLLAMVKRLELGFVDTYPASMIIDENTIGKTTIAVSNPNHDKLADFGFKIKIGLREGSVGYLSGVTEEDRLEIDGRTMLVSATQLVDGIDRSGYVKAYAYLDGNIDELNCSFSGETISFELDKDLAAQIQAKTYVEGDLGPFVSECDDNKRKLYVDPFVPGVLKNEGIFGLCKLFERYLNTMYTPLDKDCRIGILEKIHRISEFKNPDACEAPLLTNFASEHGSELAFNYEDVKEAADVLAKYEDKDLRQTKEELAETIYRRYYSILPYIDRWKGTPKSIELLYRVLGIKARLIPLWEGPTHEMIPEYEVADSTTNMLKPNPRVGDDFRLTSHLSIALTSAEISTADMKKLSDFAFKAVKSILPVNRVISDVKIYDEMVSELSDLFLFHTLDIIEKKPAGLEKIAFSWNCDRMIQIKNTTSDTAIKIEVPMYADFTEVGHSSVYQNAYPIPENCAYYFTRFREMIKTYGSLPIYFSIAKRESGTMNPTGMVISFRVLKVDLRRDKVVLTCQKEDGSNAAISSFNTNTQSSTDYMNVSFKFSRAAEDYCEPITLAAYRILSAMTYPYNEEAANE